MNVPEPPPADRPAREKPPAFCPAEPVAERLAGMFTALVTELAVLRERLDTMERLLAARDILPADAVEAYIPDRDAEAARAAWREQYLERIFAELHEEAAALSRKTDSV